MDRAATQQRALREAVRALLRPLARLLIAEQLPLASFQELLKEALVEEAAQRFRIPGKPVSDSRITLLTGVHRKDVKRLRRGEGVREEPEAPASLGARLIADWCALPHFVDDEGEPLPLYRNAGRGRPSFRDLVESAGRDIRPQAVLDEWLRTGQVRVDDENRVHLVRSSFVPEDVVEKLDFLGRNLSAHLATSAHNLAGEGEPRLDQCVYYGGLGEESTQRLAERARELGMRALRALNREAHALQRADRRKRSARRRIHFGVYFHEAPDDSASEPDA